MLKVFLGFMVSVVVLLASAYVLWGTPRAYAASASVLITNIQVGGIGAPTQELIGIYNNSPDEVDITGWCLTNKNTATIACFDPPVAGQTMYLPAYRYAVAVSSTYVSPLETTTVIFTPANQSSGSIVGTSDSISLVDAHDVVVDQHAWTVPITAGQQFERRSVGDPVIYEDTDTAADWSTNTPGVVPVDGTEVSDFDPVVCFVDEDMPILEEEVSDLDECHDLVLPVVLTDVPVPIRITEILPNAAGSDSGKEFIELFNPNDVAVDLSDYVLYVGLHDENSYYFPAGSTIAAGGYLSFSNIQIPFSLLNSSSLVRLTLRDGTIVSDVPAYMNPRDDESWADFDGQWQYTNRPTPGFANLASEDSKSIVVATPEPMIKACAANQYRSLETNRCRLISSIATTAAITPCKDGQYRSEETNRCRTIVVAAESVACKEGQARNPETNRCRTVTKMPSVGYGVLGAETKSNGNWYALAVVIGVLLVAVAYAVWEWHDELGKLFRKCSARVIRFARLRK